MKIFNYLAIFITLVHLTNADQSLQCGEWDPYKDEKCFKILDKKEFKTYSDAKTACYQNEGSSLVTIRSLEEQDFVYNLLIKVHQIVNDVWIGAQYSEQVFRWTDNSFVNFTNWPNDYPKNDIRYQCVQMSMDPAFTGKWLNEPCDKLNVVVCQKEQNWLFSHLQKTVMDLRESYMNLTKHFESSRHELEKTKSDLEITKTQFANTKTELGNTITELENTKVLLNQVNRKATDASPSGTVAFFTSVNAPSGWLKANGQQVSRTQYATLFAITGTTFGSGDGNTTFTLPDLRGEFIRGWSDGRDVDKQRNFGTFQWGSNIPRLERVNDLAYVALADDYTDRWGFSGSTFDGGYELNIPAGQTRDGTTFPGKSTEESLMGYVVTTNQGHITTWNLLKGARPRNVALLACIKY